jgi:hypothetical protein
MHGSCRKGKTIANRPIQMVVFLALTGYKLIAGAYPGQGAKVNAVGVVCRRE